MSFSPVLLLGILGGSVLVAGSAWPDKKTRTPIQSIKNWFLALGTVLIASFSLLNYAFLDGAIHFLFLQTFALIASLLMMLSVSFRWKVRVLTAAAISLFTAACFFFDHWNVSVFLVGMATLSLGYVLPANTTKREAALMLGSLFLALFSALTKDPVFLFLNVFFAIFSGAYWVKGVRKKKYSEEQETRQ